MRNFWEKYIKGKGEKAQIKVNEACYEIKSKMRNVTAKHKGYEEFSCLNDPNYVNEFNCKTEKSTVKKDKNHDDSKPKSKALIKIQKPLALINAKNAISSFSSTVKLSKSPFSRKYKNIDSQKMDSNKDASQNIYDFYNFE